jgi:hypothetical protein
MPQHEHSINDFPSKRKPQFLQRQIQQVAPGTHEVGFQYIKTATGFACTLTDWAVKLYYYI